MAFTNDSEKLIDFFLNDIYSKKRTILHQKQSDDIFKKIHANINTTSKLINVLHKKRNLTFEFEKIKNVDQLAYHELFTSHYVDTRCYDYVKNNILGVFTLTSRISDLDVKITYGIYDKKELNNLKKLEKTLLHALKIVRFCNLYRTNKEVKSVKVLLHLTPIEKKLPTDNTDVLGPPHVNSAVTFACSSVGELLIYRHEEWKKTLIHELFHSLCLDFSINNYGKFKRDVGGIFDIKSDFLISECYCEIWANIINCCFCSYSFLEDKDNWGDFILYTDFCIYMEKIFSIFQCIKILDFMNLKYEHLWKKDKISESYRNMLYTEKTNVFCYYILKMILLQFSDEFLSWCLTNNANVLNFDSSGVQFNKFFTLINKYYKSKYLLDSIKTMGETFVDVDRSTDMYKTTKMTICDYYI